jgi:hypothetical protein
LWLWLYSVVLIPIANAKRLWTLPNLGRHGSTHRSNIVVAGDGVVASTSVNDHDVTVRTEYVVVCVLAIGGNRLQNSRNNNETEVLQPNSNCILVEMIPSNSSATIKQLRYHYYPNIFTNFSSVSGEFLPLLWRGVGLLSDVVILHFDSLHDEDESFNDRNDWNLIPTFVMGLRQRQSANLSPTTIYIVVSNTTMHYERAQRWRNELQSVTSFDMVRSIEIVNGTQPENDNLNNINIVDIPIPSPQEHGSHTITDCSTFINALQETFHRLAYNASNPQPSLLPCIDNGSDDVIIIDSVPSKITATLVNVNNASTHSVPREVNTGSKETRTPTFPKLSFGWKLSLPRIPRMRRLQSLLLRSINKGSKTHNINENVLYTDDDLRLDIDRLYQQLCEVQNQQEEYMLSSIDAPHVVAFDLIPIIHPIMEQLHTILSRLRSHPPAFSESFRELDPIYEQMATIYEYQCNTILRNYYGTMYETIFDQQRHQLSTKWVHSLQDRMKENYGRDIKQILSSLERYDDVYLSFSKAQPNALDPTTLITHFMSDLQSITELHIDVSDMDHTDDGSSVLMNDIMNPNQYRNRLRRQRLYQFSKNVLKRAVMIGVNYIQGYIAIQSIRHIALQQEREMPKFPLF